MSKLIATLLITLLWAADMAAQSGIYVGGHIRRERPNTVTKLKNSGFTYAILFNVNVETDGTLTTDGETICKDGVYVFANQQPHYVEDVEALKTWPTGIQRLEICIGGWGNESYYRIKDLINAQGTGSNTILYKNFKALKEALPWVEAVNNDDEHCYDVATAVKFHTMMYDLGYKTTVAPYMNKSFWQSLVSQLNNKRAGACDCVLIQCYGGGANNNPNDWHFGNIPLHAGRENYQDGSNLTTCIEKMQSWHDNNNVTGGFLWVYNDETWDLNKWASAINRVFPPKQNEEPVVTLYSRNSYGGYAVSLAPGTYCAGELSNHGIGMKEIMSMKLAEGYRLTAYQEADLTGTSNSWTGGDYPRLAAWTLRISSLKIEKIDDTEGIKTVSQASKDDTVFNLQGQPVQQPQRKGIYVKDQHKFVVR
ncbi:hypothetical protein [Xylanibacter brevis]|uniref:hypothetical protein n=1 Tax=Xylanibacter brevis TaxID=83231 RepID=UPI000B0810B7|nr:hypothetical protein [Xylanibacter brevis]